MIVVPEGKSGNHMTLLKFNNKIFFSFKCPDLKSRDINKCFYKNETYQVREHIKESQVAGTCNVNCFCSEGRDGDPAEFVCAIVDCPEFFNGYNPSKKCIMQYNKEDCCASNTICGKKSELLCRKYKYKSFIALICIYEYGFHTF